jgi:hypothetical protein
MNICDLTKGAAFFPERNTPPVPIAAAFGTGPLHQCKRQGKWNFDQAVSECAGELIRSFKIVFPKESLLRWEDLIFRFGEREFLCAEESRIVGYAETALQAEKITEDFSARFGITEQGGKGQFRLIRRDKYDAFACEDVALSDQTELESDAFRLFYPGDAAAWHMRFLENLRRKKCGLSILEGSPGTGKTTYLRYLIRELEASHRFYFVPPSGLSMLSNPDFIGFWSREMQASPKKKFVMILEDAEAALMSRAGDNRDLVSALLNLTDGMLGDFLSIQIICTINCRLSEVDSALLRAGRLIAHRVFRKLAPTEMHALADHLGKKAPDLEECTLAEIFSETITDSQLPRRMGFGFQMSA